MAALSMDTSSMGSTDSMSDNKKNLVFFSHEYPNEDVQNIFRRLQRHSKDKRFRVLSIFLDEAKDALKEEVSNLPQHLRDLVPPFDSIITLADGLRDGPVKSAVEAALLVTLELAMFIGHYESQSLEYDLLTADTIVTGLTMGLLAAAAVCLAPSLSELARIGPESIRIAFRFNIEVESLSQSLEASHLKAESGDSWAYVVSGLTAEVIQRELDQFNAETANPELTTIYISATDGNTFSVTGPPSRLKLAFKHSQILGHSNYFPLPVYGGLCHAPYLFTKEDIRSAVNYSPSRIGPNNRVLLPLLSTSTGQQFTAKYADELYEQIATELMCRPVKLYNLVDGIQANITSPEISECKILMLSLSLASRRLFDQVEARTPQLTFSWSNVMDWSAQEFEPRIPRTHKEAKLAIVGMSCRMPGGANDNELFWDLMVQGRDTHTTVPPDRFDLETHYDPTGNTPNASQVKWGNFIDQPGLFDPGFFNMSPREAEQTDPMHRLALITAYEALEMSGYTPNRTTSTNLRRIGTYYGQASDDWRELNGSQNIGTYHTTGGVRAFANGRLNYFFGFEGPSFNIDTACSSSAAAINAACSALWAGEADTVLAGGLNIITDPDNFSSLGTAHFLSKTGQCKVWDETADGYCRADGVGSIVIKRLEDAEKDNDKILGVVLAGTTNHSAEAISITHPHAGAQKSNYQQVLQNAGVDPRDVSYVELHGTGTQAGDGVESESVLDVFAPVENKRRPSQKLLLGSVKSNIGHGEAAAGIASIIKVLLMYQKNQIPPHIGITTVMNPKIPQDMAERNAALVLENISWLKQDGKKRLSIVNGFGAHGGNTTFLLEDAPEKLKIGVDPRSTHTVTISAKSKNSLRGNIEAMLSYLERNPDTDLGDLGYTTCARRIQHSTRVAVATSNIPQLTKFLQDSLAETSNIKPVPGDTPDIVFTFTGQGAFYRGISARLFKEFPAYRAQIIQLDHIVEVLGFPSVLPAIDGSLESEPSAIVTQLAVIVVEIALTRFWALLGIKPSAVIGHSLGEYAAMVVAGILSASDAIFLAGTRAKLLMECCEAGSHIMLSVRASVEDIQKACPTGEVYEISCINGTADTVISGSKTNIEATRKALENAGPKTMQLDVPYAFHTKQIEPILDSFEQVAKHVTFKEPTLPYISPLLSNCVFDAKSINAKYLVRASREPVNFVGALKAATELGTIDEKTLFLDIGPHPVAGGLVRNYMPKAKVLNSLRRNEDNFTTISNTLTTLHLEGFSVCWNEYYRPFEKAHDLLLLEKYRWNEKNYWIQYLGTWTLDKALIKDNLNKPKLGAMMPTVSPLKTAAIHQVIKEEVNGSTCKFVALTDMTHPEFLQLMRGHKMNGNPLAATSIWIDVGHTVGDYLSKKMSSKTKEVNINLQRMEVHVPQVSNKDKTKAQLVQLEANIDMTTETMTLQWYNVTPAGTRHDDFFASASVQFEDAADWHTQWDRVEHLVNGRIDALTRMAAKGTANKISKHMAYALFNNCVDYGETWRGMDTVLLNDYEAYADITLLPGGEYVGAHSPAPWVDSMHHISGFILNGGDRANNRDFFYVTDKQANWRVSQRFKAGEKYGTYVRMFPHATEEHTWVGDVYMLQEGKIIGEVTQMSFHGIPRLLLDFFMSPSDVPGKATFAGQAMGKKFGSEKSTQAPTPAPKNIAAPPKAAPVVEAKPASPVVETPKAEQAAPIVAEANEMNPLIANALQLIANESGADIADLVDDSTFVEIGCDSLMSLVLSEKFRKELRIDVKSSVFIECPTVGELKGWLERYC